MSVVRPSPHPVVAALVRVVLMPWLSRRARLSTEGLREVQSLQAPFIVVANHVNFWDPFWVAACVRQPVQFVASDNLFRTPLLGTAMKLLGAIPKTKLMNDLDTVRLIHEVLRAGGVVGIFPEGSRSDDGRSSDLIPAVARLVRRMRVPVLGARIMGGYLSRPRWARHARRGSVRIAWKLLLAPDDARAAGDEQVLATMRRHLTWDETAWQRTRMARYPGRRPAEYLERLLFVCPHCRSLSSLRSQDDRLRCTVCEYAVRLTEYGFFEPCTSPLYFDNPADWNAWQLPVLDRILGSEAAFGEFIFQEKPCRLLVGWRSRPLRTMERGTARLCRQRIVFHGDSGLAWSFSLSGVQGMNVQNREKLEFYHERVLYRLDFLDPRASPYKWVRAVESLVRAGRHVETGWTDQVRSRMRVNTY